jgi:ubiquitin C-terminal hydrolase
VHAPENFIIQLNRFTGGNKVERNNTPVGISEGVDLSLFCDEGSAMYEGKTLLNHSGTLTTGHYTATCKRSNCWYWYADKVAQRSAPDGRASESTYLIFIEKVVRG